MKYLVRLLIVFILPIYIILASIIQFICWLLHPLYIGIYFIVKGYIPSTKLYDISLDYICDIVDNSYKWVVKKGFADDYNYGKF